MGRRALRASERLALELPPRAREAARPPLRGSRGPCTGFAASSSPRRRPSLYHDELEGVRSGLAFQGIGPDGHTASLFPNDPALAEQERRAVAVHRDDVDRVTLTLPVLCAAEIVLFLVLGEEKADAVRRAFAEPPGPQTPASLVRSEHGRTVALLDRAAAAGLPS